jgi:DNA mismatch repair ATPase MutS
MAEAVGLASAILGLTIFAYDTSKSLYEAVSSFRTQRKTVKDLQDELNSLTTILGSIRTYAEGLEEVQRLEPLRKPLERCLTICQEMRESLEACTKHSAEGRGSVRDWLNMRYHGKSFEDIRKQLSSYKSTLSITFASINM